MKGTLQIEFDTSTSTPTMLSSRGSNDFASNLAWPEEDDAGISPDKIYSGCSPLPVLRRWSYSYMNGIFKKGAKIHRHSKERRQASTENSNDGDPTSSDDEIDAGKEHSSDEQQQLDYDDLFAPPKCMRASNLQPKFRSLYNANANKVDLSNSMNKGDKANLKTLTS